MKMNTEVINASLEKLMTIDEYSNVKHDKPYIFEITSKDNSKSILFFGAKHTADPGDSMFPQLKTSFENYKPDLVIVEAAPGPQGLTREEFNAGIVSQTIDEVIKRRGEPGFTIRMAVENGIEWFCPEPDRNDEFQYLLEEGYSQQEIQAWALFRNIPVFNKRRGERTFDEFARSSITHFLEKTGWSLTNSIEDIINTGKGMIGEDIDVKNDMEIHKYINPGEGNKMQKLSKLSWAYRDRTILENIITQLDKYDHIFIVYGASHAVVQEPALRYLFSTL